MVITETKLKGAFVIALEPFNDSRGFFARAWSDKEFEDAGINARFVETNVSFNKEAGTLRGMHFQLPPHAQGKLVRCVRGSIYDVVIDLRPDSATFKQWVGVEISAENHLLFYAPPGFAHGYQTLVDDTEVIYQTTAYYAPEHAGGVRWNDPAFNITWPVEAPILIDRDRNYEDFTRDNR